MTVSVLNRADNSINLYDREIDDDEFFELCQRNPEHKFEKNLTEQ